MNVTLKGRLAIDAMNAAVVSTQEVVARRSLDSKTVGNEESTALFCNYLGRELYKSSGIIGKSSIRRMLNKIKNYENGHLVYSSLYRGEISEDERSTLEQMMHGTQQTATVAYIGQPFTSFNFTTQF